MVESSRFRVRTDVRNVPGWLEHPDVAERLYRCRVFVDRENLVALPRLLASELPARNSYSIA